MKMMDHGQSGDGGIVSLNEDRKFEFPYAPQVGVGIQRLSSLADRIEYSPDIDTVLFVAENIYPFFSGGAEVSMHNIMAGLAAEGYDAYSVRPSSSAEVQKQADGVTCVRTPRSIAEVIGDYRPFHVITQLRMSIQVIHWASHFKIDSTLFIRSTAEHFCAFRERRKHVCSEGGYVDLLNCGRTCLDKNGLPAASHSAFQDATNIVCNSDYMRQAVARFFGREDAIVQYPSITQVDLSRSEENDTVVVVRPRVGKGNVIFEEMARRMVNRRFVCIGDHDINLDSVGDNVEFFSEVDVKQIGDIYRRCKVLIKPNTDMESFGRIVPEAGAFGIPAVCTRIGGLSEAMGDGGVLIPIEQAEDVNVWIQAVQEIESDYERYSRLAIENSRRFRQVDTMLEVIHLSQTRCNQAPIHVDTSSVKRMVITCGDFPGVRSAFKHLSTVLSDLVEFVSFHPNISFGDVLTVFGGWSNEYRVTMEREVGTFAHSWHSSLTQLEQSNEYDILSFIFELVKEGRYRYIFTSCPDFAKVIGRAVGNRVARWLPDTIDTSRFEGVEPKDLGEGFHIDVFMPGHHRKNLLPQLIASANVGALLHANTFISRSEWYKWFIEAHRVQCLEHSFMPDEFYFRFIAGMDVGVQVSFAESFCYYAVERMLLGVPVLTSTIVPATRFEDPMLREYLVVKDPSSVDEMEAKLRTLKDDPELRAELGRRCQEHSYRLAEFHNTEARRVVEEVLNEF